jgi:hypothetical protein
MTTNNRIEARIRVKWLKALRPYEVSMFKSVRSLLKKEYTYIADNYETISQYGFSILRRLDLQTNLKNVLSRIINEIIPISGRMVEREINNQVNKADFDYEAYIIEYLSSETFLQSIGFIVTTFYDDIQQIIASGIARQATKQDITKDIMRIMTEKSKFRAETIAITETHKASSYASDKRAKDMQRELNLNMRKKWVAVQDARTRNTHLSMRSKEAIGMNEMFVVGGEKMDRPHASGASAGNTIRCRCVLRYIVGD